MKILVLRGAMAGADERGALALAADSGPWVLVNASPAVALELGGQRRLPHAQAGPDATLAGLILTDAHIEHAGGLLSLRDGAPLDLYATPAVFEDLTTALPLLPVLDHYCGVHWHVVPVAGDRRVATFRVQALPTLEFTAIAIGAAAPPYSAHAEQPVTGDAIALAIRDLHTGQSVFCAPGLTQIGAIEFDWMRQADCLLVDEPPLATDSEPDPAVSWMDLLSDLPARHKVLLPGGRAEHTDLAERGIARAYHGMAIEL